MELFRLEEENYDEFIKYIIRKDTGLSERFKEFLQLRTKEEFKILMEFPSKRWIYINLDNLWEEGYIYLRNEIEKIDNLSDDFKNRGPDIIYENIPIEILMDRDEFENSIIERNLLAIKLLTEYQRSKLQASGYISETERIEWETGNIINHKFCYF